MAQATIESEVKGAAKRLLNSNPISDDVVGKILYDNDSINIESPADAWKAYSEYDQERDALVETVTRSLTGKSADQFAPDQWDKEWGRVRAQMLEHPFLAEHALRHNDQDSWSDAVSAVEGALNQELARATCLMWDLSEEKGIIYALKEPVDADDPEQAGDVDEKMRQAYDEALARLENEETAA